MGQLNNTGKNSAKIYTTPTGGELRISTTDSRNTISATNNKAQYYAEMAQKYRDEAKAHEANAKFYAEQNSDVTFEYIDEMKTELENKINAKQQIGDYALKEELPENVSELENDMNYATVTQLESLIPDISESDGLFLSNDGENLLWRYPSTIPLFTMSFALTKLCVPGWVDSTPYYWLNEGYEAAYQRLVDAYNGGTDASETVNSITVSYKYNSTYNMKIITPSQVGNAENIYNSTGNQPYFILDTENTRFKLPRFRTILSSGNPVTDFKLYFYLGSTELQPISITGEVLESLNNKLDLNDANNRFKYLKESYQNGYSWYRVFSDNFCIQGGFVEQEFKANAYHWINLMKSYNNTNFTVQATLRAGGTNCPAPILTFSRSNSSFEIRSGQYASSGYYWCTWGYIW